MPKKNKIQKRVSIAKGGAANARRARAAEIKPVAAAPAKPAAKSRVAAVIYWIIIAMFVGTSCYMLSVFDKRKAEVPGGDNVQVTDDELRQTEPAVAVEAAVDPSEGSRVAGEYKLIGGDVIGALNDFADAIEKNPSEPLNYIFRGEVLMAGANFDAAIRDFDAAIRLDSESITAYYDRALANIKLENLSDAKNDLDRAVNACAASYDGPGVVSAHDIYAKRAQVNLWLRNWSQAAGDYTAAISQGADLLDWNDYTGRAEARTNMGDYEGAVADYLSAVAIISDRIQKTPDEKTREDMSRQAMSFFEKSGALRVKLGQMDLALQDLQAAHTLAIALDDDENRIRLQILISSIR
jgi:tetratricopeptide (TPR) repeat protein